MNHKIAKIIFFGSGPVAEESLKLLLPDFEIEAVITKPPTVDEMKTIIPNAPVYSVTDKQNLDKLIINSNFESTLAILIDFGIIVSQSVIDHFPDGIINSHFSLLPEWRGADPITFAILSGQKQTGVSLMLLVEKMDEGPLLAQASYSIPEDATTPELTSALIKLSAAQLKEITPLYLSHKVEPVSQSKERKSTYSRKLTKEDGIIDWSKSAQQLEREIRAFAGWPKSHARLAGREIIVTKAMISEKHGQPAGKVSVEGQRLFVYCGDGSLEIKRLKPAGKSEMSAEAFLAGYRQYL